MAGVVPTIPTASFIPTLTFTSPTHRESDGQGLVHPSYQPCPASPSTDPSHSPFMQRMTPRVQVSWSQGISKGYGPTPHPLEGAIIKEMQVPTDQAVEVGSKRFTKVGLTLEIKYICSQCNSFYLTKFADPGLFQMNLVCPEMGEAMGAVPMWWQTWPPVLILNQVFSSQGRTTLQDLCQD